MEGASPYKWVDSKVLKHHCGVCGRPLAHPAAKTTCFGPHAEPCPRFHKAMFMPSRGDTCQACKNVELVHNKRHTEIGEQLRVIYTLSGVGPYIGPVVTGPDKLGNTDVNHSMEEEQKGQTKKQRKEAKKLARAAARPRVVKVEELTYVNSVLHPHQISNNDDNSPLNGQGVDDNFESEIVRILDDFQITKLFKQCSGSSRQLQEEDLESFEKAVGLFKSLVTEDLELVRKDETETLMRRAGYLDYTSKASFNIIQERLGSKSGTIRSETLTVGTLNQEPAKENIAPSETVQLPDHRHLHFNSKRVYPDGSTVDPGSDPATPPKPPECPSPRKSKLAWTQPDQPPAQTFLLPRLEAAPSDETIRHEMSYSNALRKQSTPPYHQASRIEQKTRRLLSLRPPEKQSFKEFVVEEESAEKEILEVSHPAVSNKKAKKKQYQAKRETKVEPEREGSTQVEAVEVQEDLKAIKNMKDLKEHQNGGTQSPSWSNVNPDVRNPSIESQWHKVEGADTSPTVPKTLSHSGDLYMESHGKSHDPPIPIKSRSPQPDHAQFCTPHGCISPSPPGALAVATTGKVMDWTAYTHQFVVDTLNNVVFGKHCECHCPYFAVGFLDCPYDVEWQYGDPSENNIGVVYPTYDKPIVTRWCNRAYGERLLSMFNEHSLTKARMMIIDECVLPFLYSSCSPTGFALASMARANIEDAQLTRFETVFKRNFTVDKFKKVVDDPVKARQMILYDQIAKDNECQPFLSKTKLKQIQKEFEPKGVQGICYCQGPVDWPNGKGTVDCNYKDCMVKTFHRYCVRDSRPDTVTRWYCLGCEKRMGAIAGKLNEELGLNDLMEELDLDHWCAEHMRSFVNALC